MEIQNLHNHTRHDTFLYTLSGCAILLGCAIGYIGHQVNSVISLHGLQYIMPIFVPVFLIALMTKMRMYATKLQDRIIRQEIQIRYFLGAGQQLPSDITITQMVGLRFASDEEFITLAQQVAKHPERTSKEIKTQIKQRKADHNRV